MRRCPNWGGIASRRADLNQLAGIRDLLAEGLNPAGFARVLAPETQGCRRC